MAYTVKEIAAALGAFALGDGDVVIERLSEPASAQADHLALATNPKYAEALAEGSARAALLWQGADWQALGLEAAICVGRPRHAMAKLTAMHDEHWKSWGQEPGMHATALVHPTASVADASIGPYAVIGANVQIGEGSFIGAHVSIGPGTRLGPGAVIRDGARIGDHVTAGANFILHSSAVIGCDGFSFVTPERSSAEALGESLGDEEKAEPSHSGQPWERIHSLGTVIIGDDVEIGAATTIDRGTIRATRIGDGTKIDNLVQVGHNCEIGRHCLLCGHVGLAGSIKVGDHVIMGGKTGVIDNVSIGDNVITGGASVIMANVPAGRVMLGYPATQMKSQIDSYKALRRLPRDMATLKKAVSKLTGSD
ncbi:MAG: UDP-3-O-(3-hydroxymyristoyl)glucosamine N-acyltransferase [Pseudomonadota bacterium]